MADGAVAGGAAEDFCHGESKGAIQLCQISQSVEGESLDA